MTGSSELRQQIEDAVRFLQGKTDLIPKVGIICGTGMGALADSVENPVKIPYDNIPHFAVSTVESHHGNLVFGKLAGQPVMVMQGRFHFYEGYTMGQVTFPVRVMKALGCRAMIVMNAVGSMNHLIPPGGLLLITDHINMMGQNPLIGPNDDTLGPRFPDMSEPYARRLIALAEDVALKRGIRVHKGVAISVTGPNLETAAEYRFFRRIGADVVTMSTIPEVIVANHAGLKVLGISTITDACLPDALRPASVEEIIHVAVSAEPRLTSLVTGVLERIGEAIE